MQKLCCVRTRQHPLPVWSHKFVLSSTTHISTNSHPFLVGIVSRRIWDRRVVRLVSWRVMAALWIVVVIDVRGCGFVTGNHCFVICSRVRVALRVIVVSLSEDVVSSLEMVVPSSSESWFDPFSV